MTYITKMFLKGFKSFAKPTELEFGKGFSCVIGPNGSGKSVQYDTEVLLDIGQVMKVGDLVEQKLKEASQQYKMNDGIFVTNNEDINILSLDPETMQVVKKPVTAFIRREGEPYLYEIKTVLGKKIITTGCHPVMIFKANKVVSERVENLKQGDHVASPRTISLEEKEIILPKSGKENGDVYEITPAIKINKYINENFARFLGYLVGDGCLHIISRVEFVNADEELIEEYTSLLKEMGASYTLRTESYTKAKRVYTDNKTFLQYLKQVFDDKYKKEEKHIPSSLFSSKRSCVAAFIGALFDCDATVSKTTPTIEYTTMSETLCNQLQLALLRFGIVARKFSKLKYATNTEAKKKKEYYYLAIEGRERLKQFAEYIGFICQHKRERVLQHLQRETKTNHNIDLLPQETNRIIKQCVNALGIACKPLRKEHPRLAAYVENRCNPTREGIEEILTIFYEKLRIIADLKQYIQYDQSVLCDAMRVIGCSSTKTAQAVGVRRGTIVDIWENERWQAKPESIDKFYNFIKMEIEMRVQKADYYIQILEKLARSDIFWDKIVAIRQVKGEKYVYDLSISETHNFLANNLFVHNSNVMDSICFVLGKMSAKSMRAEKTANLIFNGGKNGNPLKEAEVSIFFDNTKKEFPIEAGELKLSRIVRQNGQSVYKINDEVRTRQQVVETLAAAKVDPDGHNIILQGDIVHFMEMKTEERRQIVEEIAGISVYEDRKAKALAELGKVDGKLNEATIILTEREAYMRELKKDRDQAVKYKDLEKNIQSSKATFLHLQIEEKEERKKEIEDKIKQCEADIAAINTKIKDIKETITARKKELEEIAKLIEEKGEKEAIALQKELEHIKTEAVKNKERLHTCKNEIAKVQERKKQLEITFQDLEKTIKDLQKAKQERETKRKELGGRETKLEEELKIFKEKHGGAASAGDLENAEKEVESLEEDIKKLQDEREKLLQKKFQLDAQIAQYDEKIKSVQSLAKEFDFEKIKKDLETTEKSLRKSLNDDSFFAVQLSDTKEQLLKKEEELFVLQARDAGRKNSAMSNLALKKILSLQQDGIYGTVAQLGAVDKKYALALDVAAGSRMNNVVVKDDKTAADCIALLKRDKLGVATFLPLNKIKTKSAPNLTGKGVIGNALGLISFDQKFKDVFSFVLGDTIVIDNLDTARRIGIGKAKLVTVEGDLAEMSGAMIGGYRQKNMASAGFQEKQDSGTINEIEEAIERLQKVKAALEKRRSENQENIDKYRHEKSSFEGDLIKAEKSVGSFDLASIKAQREKLLQDAVFKDLKACEQELKKQETGLESSKKARDKLREAAKDLSHPDIELQREKIEERRQKIREEIVQAQTEIKNIDTQITNIYEPEKEKSLQIMKGHEKEIESFVKEAKKLEDLLKEQEKSLKEKEQQELKFQRDYKDLFTKRTKITEEVQKKESSISVEEMKIKEIERRMNERSINRAKIVGELEGLQKEFEDFKGVPLRKQIAAEKLKEEIKKFEDLLQQMGNVNLRALEVYETIVKEYDELLKKIEKLKTEKDDVLSMIDEIESKKKDLFMETFKVIAKNFTRIFSSLSTKGEAFLEVEDKENPLSAGIDIRVRLLGNKFLDIKSLSGGEKTMSAIAFIFAIQEHQPGSFYILDEVDAALDKRNSELLSKLVGKYAEKAQYILISHNDSVITEAERIYGVSMQQTGMSKVVSLKF